MATKPKGQDTPATEQTGEDAVRGEVIEAGRAFSDDVLQGIESFDDAVSLAMVAHGGIVMAHEEIGNGFAVAEEVDKRRLVGVPLMLLEWQFRAGDFGDYVSILAVAQGENGNATKWVINDGSTGIAAELREFTKRTRKTGGLLVRKGLRISEYLICSTKGCVDFQQPLSKAEVNKHHAEGKNTAQGYTFYLDTSA